MNLIDLIKEKRQHMARLANQKGAAGELNILSNMSSWIPRPKGIALAYLLKALEENNTKIKSSSFDAIEIAESKEVDFLNIDSIKDALPFMTFIEIKTSNQARVKGDFSGFFFAMTENEISASDILGTKHKVALFNNITGDVLITSVPEILQRAKSSNWQLSVQL